MITGYMVKVHHDRLLGRPRAAGEVLTIEDLAQVNQAVLSSLVGTGILEPQHSDDRGDAVVAALADLRGQVEHLAARVDNLTDAVGRITKSAAARSTKE